MQRAALLVALVAACAPVAARADATEAIDLARSRAAFSVTHLYVTHVDGSVPISGGTVTFASPGAAIPTHVDATLDPRRVATDDRDRDEDLQGPDWFDVAKFPEWTFASTAIAATATGFTIAGTLTVHGVAQPVSLDVTAVRSGPHGAFHATGKVDRHAFGMRITPMDGVIGNEITLTLDVQLR